jgi:predicted DNA-binding transcriptional regulator AlpA
MSKLSTNQVAKKLGLTSASLTRYIQAGKVPAPPETMAGGFRMRLWSESDIERLKEILPKIANGRKTRYKKKPSALSSQQSAKTKTETRSKTRSKKKK